MKTKMRLSRFYLIGFCLCCLGLSSCLNLKPKVDDVKLFALGPIETESVSAAKGPAIYISRPDLPAYLDGKRLQFRKDNGEIGELKNARWAEPLEEGVARALAEYLLASGEQQVSGFYPWPMRSRDGLELRVHFYKLGALASGEIRMVANWELRDSKQILKAGKYQSEGITWVLGQAESQVEGLNRALAQLALEVSASL
jgi:uncharacterized lipoprotein YmbA